MKRPPLSQRCCARPLLFIGLLLALLTPRTSHAVDFEVAARTVAQAFEYLRVNRDVEARQRITQYLSFNGHDLLGDGENKLRVVSLMRFDTDLALAGRANRDFSEDPFGLERRYNVFHVLYLYVEGEQLWNFFDFRVGRQLQSDVFGWYDYDGLYLSARIWRGLAVETYGGLEVKQDVLAINDAAFDPDGTNPEGSNFELFDEPVFAIGTALRYNDLRYGQARFTYRRTFRQINDGVETDRIGGSAQVRPLEQLRFYGNTVHNFFVARIERANAGAEWQFVEPDLTLGAEYFHFLPVFDADSIFNVFSIRAYDEGRGRVGWQINDGLYAMVRFGVRFYSQDDVLAETNEDTEDTTYTARFQLRARTIAGIWTNLTHQTEVGFGGQQFYTALSGQTPFYFDLWRVTARVLHTHFDAQYTTGLEGDAFGANLGGAIKLGDVGQFEILAEQAINPFVKSETRILALLDLNFRFSP